MESTTALEKKVRSTNRTDSCRASSRSRSASGASSSKNTSQSVRATPSGPDDRLLHGPHRLQARLAHQGEELHRPLADDRPVRDREPCRKRRRGEDRKPGAGLPAGSRGPRSPRLRGHPREPPGARYDPIRPGRRGDRTPKLAPAPAPALAVIAIAAGFFAGRWWPAGVAPVRLRLAPAGPVAARHLERRHPLADDPCARPREIFSRKTQGRAVVVKLRRAGMELCNRGRSKRRSCRPIKPWRTGTCP